MAEKIGEKSRGPTGSHSSRLWHFVGGSRVCRDEVQEFRK